MNYGSSLRACCAHVGVEGYNYVRRPGNENRVSGTSSVRLCLFAYTAYFRHFSAWNLSGTFCQSFLFLPNSVLGIFLRSIWARLA